MKKPFYKRVWFIVLAVFVGLVAVGAALTDAPEVKEAAPIVAAVPEPTWEADTSAPWLWSERQGWDFFYEEEREQIEAHYEWIDGAWSDFSDDSMYCDLLIDEGMYEFKETFFPLFQTEWEATYPDEKPLRLLSFKLWLDDSCREVLGMPAR